MECIIYVILGIKQGIRNFKYYAIKSLNVICVIHYIFFVYKMNQKVQQVNIVTGYMAKLSFSHHTLIPLVVCILLSAEKIK